MNSVVPKRKAKNQMLTTRGVCSFDSVSAQEKKRRIKMLNPRVSVSFDSSASKNKRRIKMLTRAVVIQVCLIDSVLPQENKRRIKMLHAWGHTSPLIRLGGASTNKIRYKVLKLAWRHHDTFFSFDSVVPQEKQRIKMLDPRVVIRGVQMSGIAVDFIGNAKLSSRHFCTSKASWSDFCDISGGLSTASQVELYDSQMDLQSASQLDFYGFTCNL
uniref:Uncharacterized protein n=1 Tax=Ditylenchus dipsaci TaxID=166011 RepID=A0A915E332_9BILA